MDRGKLVLMDALKAGAIERGEMRLYRRGKLPGLFGQRTRSNAEIAYQAVQDGLLEVTRVEIVGKTPIEWVRVTPKGLDFLLESESPARALEELREALVMNQQGLPVWAAQTHARIAEIARNFNEEIDGMRRHFDALARRVGEAIDRIESLNAQAPVPGVPWGEEALDFLNRREQVGLGPRCPLADLFAHLKETTVDLTIKDFHAGLKQMRAGGALTLLAGTTPSDAPGPEYALLDGPSLYYYAACR